MISLRLNGFSDVVPGERRDSREREREREYSEKRLLKYEKKHASV